MANSWGTVPSRIVTTDLDTLLHVNGGWSKEVGARGLWSKEVGARGLWSKEVGARGLWSRMPFLMLTTVIGGGSSP